MKKYLYIALAAAALTSCSQDETLDIQKEAIAFGDAFVDNSTRAATDGSYGATNAIKSFQLYGTVNSVNIYNNVKVEDKTSASDNTAVGYNNVWYCPVTQYWVQGANYKFAAVVDATSVTTDETTKMPTSLSYTASTQKDMLYQEVTTTGKPTTNGGLVAFTFNHLLAKAKFTFTNTTDHTSVQSGTTYTYDISDLKITNTYASATYNTVTKSWDTASAETAATEFGSITALANGTPQECTAEKLLIPGITSVNVSFNYTIKIGNTVIYKTTTPVTASATTNIEANKAYNFNISLGLNDKIQFTVTAAPTWATPVNEVPAQ